MGATGARKNQKNEMHCRGFVEQTAAATGFMILNSSLVRGRAANSALQMGVIGCGGRAKNVGHGFIRNTNTRVHALADVFQDRLDSYAVGLNEIYAERGTAALDPTFVFKGPYAFRELTAGMSEGASKFSATGDFGGALEEADPEKQKAFEHSIRSGDYHNQARPAAESALSAILGREAAYTGGVINWYQLLESNQRWDAGMDLTRL